MSRITAHATFAFHRVGQGLFYDGTINLVNSKCIRLDFVYDCGSTRKNIIKREVNRYKNYHLASKHLDMLIISHLHNDHVSGLDELLQDIRVDYVFLPYLSPAERLILALMYPDMPAWYYDFLHDPIIYLLNRDVGTVVLFGAGGEERGGGTSPENIPPEPPKEDEKKLWIKLDDASEFKKKLFEEENAQNIYSLYIQEGRLMVTSHKGYVIALGIWVFRFFNYKLPLKFLNNFHLCVRNILKDVSIKDAIRQKNQRERLKKCYESIKNSLDNDFNNTSLMTYHMPIGRNYSTKVFPYSSHIFCYFCRCKPDCYLLFPCGFKGYFGQFLTGDIDLNHDYRKIQNHFQHYLLHTLLVQIPHHGAYKNWNHDILRDVPSPSLWIASAGIRNNYGHPNLSVIHEILYNGHYFAWSNELEKVIIKGEVEWQ